MAITSPHSSLNEFLFAIIFYFQKFFIFHIITKLGGDIMNIVKVRALLSSILLVVFIGVLVITIGVLYITKTGNPFLGMSKSELFNARNILGPIMNVLIIIHLALNWNLYKKELKVLFK